MSAHLAGTWHWAQHVVVLHRVPMTVTVTVIPQGPRSHDRQSGGWAELLLCEVSHVHLRPIPVSSSVGQKTSRYTWDLPVLRFCLNCTLVLTKLITAGLGIYFFKKTFFQGEKHAGAIVSWEEERGAERVNHQPQ